MFHFSSLSQELKQANLPGHTSVWTGKILPPLGILTWEVQAAHLQEGCLHKAIQPGCVTNPNAGPSSEHFD